MFQGYIRAFSDVEDPAEILLTEVSVYNEHSGELLYQADHIQADHIYLARSKNDLTIEFPIVEGTQEAKRRRFHTWLRSLKEKWFH